MKDDALTDWSSETVSSRLRLNVDCQSAPGKIKYILTWPNMLLGPAGNVNIFNQEHLIGQSV